MFAIPSMKPMKLSEHATEPSKKLLILKLKSIQLSAVLQKSIRLPIPMFASPCYQITILAKDNYHANKPKSMF